MRDACLVTARPGLHRPSRYSGPTGDFSQAAARSFTLNFVHAKTSFTLNFVCASASAFRDGDRGGFIVILPSLMLATLPSHGVIVAPVRAGRCSRPRRIVPLINRPVASLHNVSPLRRAVRRAGFLDKPPGRCARAPKPVHRPSPAVPYVVAHGRRHTYLAEHWP